MKRYLTIGSILFGLVFFFLGFLPRLLQAQKNNGLVERVSLPKVSVLIAKPHEEILPLVLPSITEANRSTPIWARANGYLESYFADIGDVVQQGQLLATLATPELDAQYMQSIHEYEGVKVRYELARVNAERAQKAYDNNVGSISKLDLDQFLATCLATQQAMHAAEASMTRFKELREYKNIYAPFDGVITERNVDIGSLVSSGSTTPQRLFVLAKVDIIRVFVNVPQNFYRLIQEGTEASMHIREMPDQRLSCRVNRFAKALDPTSHTMRTELHIDNKDGKIYPGLYGNVTFMLKPLNASFIVPVTAVVIRESKTQVALVDDKNVVHFTEVVIGHDFGKTIEIVGGLAVNDQIVISPTERIQEGVLCEKVAAP